MDPDQLASDDDLKDLFFHISLMKPSVFSKKDKSRFSRIRVSP